MSTKGEWLIAGNQLELIVLNEASSTPPPQFHHSCYNYRNVRVCVCDGSVGISFIRIKLHLCSFILWFFVFILINYLFLVMYFVCFVHPQLAEYEFVVCIHCYGKPPVNVI